MTDHTTATDRRTLARSIQRHGIDLVADLGTAAVEADTAAVGAELESIAREVQRLVGAAMTLVRGES